MGCNTIFNLLTSHLDNEFQHAAIQLGARVSLRRNGAKGTVRHVGAVHFNVGDYVGIELDDPTGNNDGTVDGIIYFTCRRNHGLFVVPLDIDVIAPSSDSPATASKQSVFHGLPPSNKLKWPVAASRYPGKPPNPPPGTVKRREPTDPRRRAATGRHNVAAASNMHDADSTVSITVNTDNSAGAAADAVSYVVEEMLLTPEFKLSGKEHTKAQAAVPNAALLTFASNDHITSTAPHVKPAVLSSEAEAGEQELLRRFDEWVDHGHKAQPANSPKSASVTSAHRTAARTGRARPEGWSYSLRTGAQREPVTVKHDGPGVVTTPAPVRARIPPPKISQTAAKTPSSRSTASAFVRARPKLPASQVIGVTPSKAGAGARPTQTSTPPRALVPIEGEVTSSPQQASKRDHGQATRKAAGVDMINNQISGGSNPRRRAQSAPRSGASRGAGSLASLPAAKLSRLRPMEGENADGRLSMRTDIPFDVMSAAPVPGRPAVKSVAALDHREDGESSLSELHHADEDVISSLIRSRVMKTVSKPVKHKPDASIRQAAQDRILRAAATLTNGPVSPVDDSHLPNARPAPEAFPMREQFEQHSSPAKTMSISDFLSQRRRINAAQPSLSEIVPPPTTECNALAFLEDVKTKYAGASLLSVLVAKAKAASNAATLYPIARGTATEPDGGDASAESTKPSRERATTPPPHRHPMPAERLPSEEFVTVSEKQLPPSPEISVLPSRRAPPPPVQDLPPSMSLGAEAPPVQAVAAPRVEPPTAPIQATEAVGSTTGASIIDALLLAADARKDAQKIVAVQPADSENGDADQQPTTKCIINAYAGLCEQGYSAAQPDKPNQDAIIMTENGDLDLVLLAVFDGHGDNGHLISSYFRERFPEVLFADPALREFHDVSDNIKSPEAYVEQAAAPRNSLLPAVGPPKRRRCVAQALKNALLVCEKEVLANDGVDCSLSGSTGCVVVACGSDLTIANVGDSRCILVRNPQAEGEAACDKQLIPAPITIDHKPTLPSEFKRILLTGGRVQSIKYDDGGEGPVRVWLRDDDIPGLAMSRSLCDTIGKKAGVVSTPDIYQYTLTPQDAFIVLATDGLWEFTKTSEVTEVLGSTHAQARAAAEAYQSRLSQLDPGAEFPSDLVEPPQHLEIALEALAALAAERWQQREGVIDDTSIVVAEIGTVTP